MVADDSIEFDDEERTVCAICGKTEECSCKLRFKVYKATPQNPPHLLSTSPQSPKALT